ncbi:MAG: hypothetical protein Q8N47_22615 [Bryobacterales bacterium]|nr:hypothetical protein [Bryobacterales bacterium]
MVLPLILCLLNPLAGLFGPENLKRAHSAGVAVAAAGSADAVELRFPAADQAAWFTIPVPEAARDWTRFETFTFEFQSDSTIRWDLQIRTRKGETFSYRVQPYQNVRARAAVARSFLTSEFMNNRQFTGHWLSNWSNHIDLTQVESLTVRMTPNRDVTLRLGPMALVETATPDAVFLDQPVVDRFGQWAPLEWPGKVHSLEELRSAWKKEDAELAQKRDFGFCPYGGWRESRRKGTGFFRVAQIDGRWWFIDPDGHLFFSAGVDCVRHRDPSRARGRQALFEKLPDGTGETVDFYQANTTLRYGSTDYVAGWKAKAEERLRAWGFNTIANWSDPAMYENPKLPFVANVSVGRSAKSWQGFPDAFSEEYVKSAEAMAAEQCGKFRAERYLIGYFIGNEPRWPGRNLIDRILSDTEASATQAVVREFLKAGGDNPTVREKLLETLSRRYFQTVVNAIRKADPNHLVLGIRWAGSAPEPVLRANDVFDVFSINIYRFEPPRDQIQRVYALTRRPVVIGEFHFGAPERGYAPSLVMVKDQTERGVAYQYYVERAAAQPEIVGAHYFQLCDQPVTGRYDGENYNLGFVNQADLPYPEMVSFARETHRRMVPVHAGSTAPADRMAKVR